jgi:hypothetical protein
MAGTVFKNRKYANIGNVTVTFSDQSTVTHSITTIGDTVFDTTGKQFKSVNVLGDTYITADLPASVTYPNSDSGTLALTTPSSLWDYELLEDEQA